MRLTVLSLFILFLFVACVKKNNETVFFLFEEEGVVIYGNSSCGDKNNGPCTIESESGEISCFGTLENGFRTGEWAYFVDEKEYNVDWEILSLSKDKLKVNVPKDWIILEVDNESSLLTMDLRGSTTTNDDYFFLVFSHDKLVSTPPPDLLIFYKYYVAEMTNDSKVKLINSVGFRDDYNDYVYSYYRSLDNKEYFNLIFEREDRFFEITLVNESIANDKQNMITFFEVLASINLDNERLFSLNHNYETFIIFGD